MLEQDEKTLVERYVAAYNGFDLDGMLALLSPQVRFENYSSGTLTASADGIEAFRTLAVQSAALFSEREQRITALHIEPGRAVADIAFRARLASDVPGGPPAGTEIALEGRSDIRFDGGLIVAIVDRS